MYTSTVITQIGILNHNINYFHIILLRIICAFVPIIELCKIKNNSDYMTLRYLGLVRSETRTF
jgi:hypothetical protein